MQMKVALVDYVKVYFLVRCQPPLCPHQNDPTSYLSVAPTFGAIVIPIFILSQNCGCAKFHTEYVIKTEYNLTNTKISNFFQNERFLDINTDKKRVFSDNG